MLLKSMDDGWDMNPLDIPLLEHTDTPSPGGVRGSASVLSLKASIPVCTSSFPCTQVVVMSRDGDVRTCRVGDGGRFADLAMIGDGCCLIVAAS